MASLIGIDLAVWSWAWLAAAVVLALVELAVAGGTFIILPWAVSAFVASILAFAGVSLVIQWAVFVLGGAIAFIIMFRWVRKASTGHGTPPGVGADRLVDMTGIVTVEVDPADTTRAGRVSVDGEVWGVADPQERLPVGTSVVVTAIRGTRVVVDPAPTSPTTES